MNMSLRFDEDELNKVICVVGKALAALDDILMNEYSELLSDAFDHLDRSLTCLCEANFKQKT